VGYRIAEPLKTLKALMISGFSAISASAIQRMVKKCH